MLIYVIVINLDDSKIDIILETVAYIELKMSDSIPKCEESRKLPRCLITMIKFNFRTKQSKCLDDLPPKDDKNTLNLYQHFGSVYDIDEQCKLFAGKDSKGCYYTDPVEVSFFKILLYVNINNSQE